MTNAFQFIPTYPACAHRPDASQPFHSPCEFCQEGVMTPTVQEQLTHLTGEVLALRDGVNSVYSFIEDVRPLLELAKTMVSGSKTERLKAVMRHGR